MIFKFYVFSPNDNEIINDIINAASEAGAGVMGKYTHCAFIQKGEGRWKSGKDSKPYIGKPGKSTKLEEVKIEMEGPAKVANKVRAAILKVHPYEEAVIDFVKLVEV